MNKTPPTARAGFTLVELLVVIAIIAILASILFPVFARARAEGKRATCLSNLRQIGDAAQMYADDSEGYLPMGHVVTAGYGPPASPTHWYRAMQPLLPDPRLVRCPSDPDVSAYLPERGEPSAEYTEPEDEAIYTSYLINGVFTDRWGTLQRARINGVRHPSDTILFAERDTRQLSKLGWSNDDDYHPWERATDDGGLPVFWGPKGGLAATRHSGGADYLYADGHVAWRKFSQTYSPDGLNQHLP
jgi:prepilin-type N-terminal cleavage/methylation domain-containing protein/prepilin-type processing-associated H-X9-DG protein